MIYITVGHVSLSFVLFESKIDEVKKEKKPVCLVDSSSQSFLVFSHVDATKGRRNKLLFWATTETSESVAWVLFFILFHPASQMNGDHLQFGHHDYYQSCIQAIRFASPFTIKFIFGLVCGIVDIYWMMASHPSDKHVKSFCDYAPFCLSFLPSLFQNCFVRCFCCCLLNKSLWFICS